MNVRSITAIGLTGSLLLAAADQPGSAARGLIITILEGSGSRNSIGTKTATAPVVQVRDGAGNPVPNATVTFELPEKGPSGFFPGLKKTQKQTTNSQGRAGTYGYIPNNESGALRIRVTAEKGSDRADAVIEQLNTRADYDSGVAPPKRRAWVVLGLIGAGAGAGIAVGLAKRGGGSSSPADVWKPGSVTVGAP
jgi:hypothetical protein